MCFHSRIMGEGLGLKILLLSIVLFFLTGGVALTHAAPEIKVVRPEAGEVLTISRGSIFVIGTVSPPTSSVTCNGQSCQVSGDGAFIGFISIRRPGVLKEANKRLCDANFRFAAESGGSETVVEVAACTPESPSAAIPAREVFEPLRLFKALREQLIGLEDGRLGDVIFIPQGCCVAAVAGNKAAVRAKTPSGGEISILTGDLEASEPGTEGRLRPWELSIPNQTTVRVVNDPEWKWPGSQLLWGFRLESGVGAPRFQPRWHLRGDGREVEAGVPLRGMRVALDPGHHPDRGAVGARGFEERESNLLLAREIGCLLNEAGAVAVMSRELEPLPLRGRHGRLRELAPDVVISVHNNSAEDGIDPRVRHGTQTFYLYPWSKPLAEQVHKAILQAWGAPDMGCIKRNLYITRFSDCPSILIEPEYIVLPDQEKRFMDSAARRQLAAAIVSGIRAFARESLSAGKVNPKISSKN
ncbi:MAG: N-acetylmuramoyl-L-alanine amidase [Verrucomicrobiae bacterium]|nr:N-acetylmuramoyl-L-alanine amidase [Verrucomicrobiae bacterium]